MKRQQAAKLLEGLSAASAALDQVGKSIAAMIDGGETVTGKDSQPIREVVRPQLDEKKIEAKRRELAELHFDPARTAPFDEEALYQRFKQRFIDEAQIDPILLRLIMDAPEIIVENQRRVEQVDGSTLRGRIAKLIVQGYLDVVRSNASIDKELGKTGTRPSSGTLSTTLSSLRDSGFLVRAGDGWQKAAGVKITETQLEAIA